MADITTDCDGRQTVGTRVVIPSLPKKLRELLSEQLGFVRQGDKVYLLTAYEVAEATFEPVLEEDEDTETNLRVQQLRATMVTKVTEAFARKHIEAQSERIRIHREELAGIGHIPGTVPAVDSDEAQAERQAEDEALRTAHRSGFHDGGLVEGCEYCDDERAAAQAESEKVPVS